MKLAFVFVMAGALAPCCLTAQETKIDSDMISGLGARNIGSAQMSGRVTSLRGAMKLAPHKWEFGYFCRLKESGNSSV